MTKCLRNKIIKQFLKELLDISRGCVWLGLSAHCNNPLNILNKNGSFIVGKGSLRWQTFSNFENGCHFRMWNPNHEKKCKYVWNEL